MKHVSVYERDGRGVWYIAYPDPITGRRVCRATAHRVGDSMAKRKAYDQAVALAKEAAANEVDSPAEAWESWVEPWMRVKLKEKTLKRYATAWKHLRLFMREQHLLVPRSVRYEHAERYLTWRTSQKRHRGTLINFNTALTELRFLGTLMREAVLRGYCQGNPITQLGISRRNVREKPEITDDEDRQIRRELLTRPEWMLECYHVAMCQGCRLTETAVPLTAIDLGRATITFRGKGHKVFTTRLHPSLRPLAERKAATKAKVLVDLPPMPAKAWWTFFREIGLPHLCFHCTKVTVITRLCRAGVPQGVAMSFVNHSSEEVHRVYQRLKVADADLAIAALASVPAWPGSH